MLGAFQNLDLLTVGIAVGATIVLGFTVYVSNPRSVTNRTFFQFSFITALWGTVNYLSYQFSEPALVLWLLRGVLFFAVLQAFFLYRLFLVFPLQDYAFSRIHMRLLIPVVACAALAAISPFAFRGIIGTAVAQQVAIVSVGPGMGIFAVVAIGLVLGGLYQLVHKLRTSKGNMRTAVLLLLGGVTLMFALIIFFNLVVATVFVNPKYIPLGAVFTFPFIVTAAYAILREHLFNIKVIGTTMLVFLLSIASFAEIIFANTLVLILFRIGVFLLVLAFGVSLIRGVLREVEQREKIQHLAGELQKANDQQVILIHFITHQIKGFVTKSRNIFAALQEGDYGPLPEPMKPLIEEGFRSDTQGASTIQQILDASNVKSGKVMYDMKPFDLKALIEEVIGSLKPAADAKSLALALAADGDFTVTGDRMQLQNAFKNLIDNSIKYTPSGSVNVSLEKKDGMARFQIQDTGVGITPEDMAHLFTEGGHGKESTKVNVDSTGYGLYIVKNIIEAHKGKIWAESEGAGKGSRFVAELPA